MKVCPLPENTSGWEILRAACPSECDAKRFKFDVTFRLAKVTVPHIIEIKEAKRVICGTKPCSRCWECPCGACQHLASWAAQKDVRVKEEQGRKDEAFKLLGQQQLLISQHWDVAKHQHTYKIVC